MRAELLILHLAFAPACQQGPAAPLPQIERPAPEALPSIDLDALRADAPSYVASRYKAADLPGALVRDLAAVGFACRTSTAATDCTRADAAFASCFDVWTVRISADQPVRAEMSRRCLGAMPPPSQP